MQLISGNGNAGSSMSVCAHFVLQLDRKHDTLCTLSAPVGQNTRYAGCNTLWGTPSFFQSRTPITCSKAFWGNPFLSPWRRITLLRAATLSHLLLRPLLLTAAFSRKLATTHRSTRSHFRIPEVLWDLRFGFSYEVSLYEWSRRFDGPWCLPLQVQSSATLTTEGKGTTHPPIRRQHTETSPMRRARNVKLRDGLLEDFVSRVMKFRILW